MENDSNSFPLVSVIVITYNSGWVVLDTLNSIRNQNYKNVELIISDDCSQDNTIEICQKWINENKSRFQAVRIIKSEINTGITPNYNRGLREARGKWVKFIAGDDILMTECINSFVKRAILCEDKIFISGVYPFTGNDITEKRIVKSEYFSGSNIQQLRTLIKKGTIIEGPTLFIHTDTLKSLGGFDEQFPFIEDYPLAMKFLSNGYRINLLEEALVKYREYPESVSKSDPRFGDSIFSAIEYYSIPLSLKIGMYHYWYHYKIFFLTNKILSKNKSLKTRILVYMLRLTDLVLVHKKIFKR